MTTLRGVAQPSDCLLTHMLLAYWRDLLNVWCALSMWELSGRCPRTRVGLLTDPEGKGTDPCSMWTPSSPHFTSSWTTSARPIGRKGGPDLMLPSLKERSLPSPSLPASLGSRVRGTSTASPRAASEALSRRCQSVRSSPAACAFPRATHRRGGLAPGADDGGPEGSL